MIELPDVNEPVVPGTSRVLKAGPNDEGTHILEFQLDLSSYGAEADKIAVLCLVPIAQALNDYLRRRKAS